MTLPNSCEYLLAVPSCFQGKLALEPRQMRQENEGQPKTYSIPGITVVVYSLRLAVSPSPYA